MREWEPDYYDDGFRRSAFLEAITQGPGQFQPATLPPGYVPPISGTMENAPSLAGPTDQLLMGNGGAIGTFEIGVSPIGQWPGPIIGIAAGLIGAGVPFQYLAAWTPTAAIGVFAIGMSAIGTRKAYHEEIITVNGVDLEGQWGSTIGFGTFILDDTPLDAGFVLAP